MNYMNPRTFINQDVAIKFFVKTSNVNVGFKIFCRADGVDGISSLGFNKTENFLKSEQGFKEVELRLFIPKKTVRIAYGIILTSNGKIEIRDIKFNNKSTFVLNN